MSSHKIAFFSVALLFISSTLTFGQAARSPFSSYGIGEQFGSGLTQNMGMGGVGISNPNFWYTNNMNPALLVFNRFTTFQVGMIGESRTQTSETSTEKSGSGNLNYMTLAIPVIPFKWTSSISLLPYTKLNYSLKYTQEIPNSGGATTNVLEQGSGGVNQFSWSNGVVLTKNLSLGLKSTYLFGSVESDFKNILTNLIIPTYPSVLERLSVSSFQFTPGVSYHIDSLFGKDYVFNAGIVYDFKTNLNVKFFQQLSQHTSSGSIIDSVTLISNQPGIITLPQGISGGISFGRFGRWTVALDGAYADYSQYRGLDGGSPYAASNWRVAAGFEKVPDPASLSSYLKRITYRTGVSLESYPYLANGNTVKDLGISFGLSLPVSRYSSLDFAIKGGKKGDKTLNSIEENYIKFYFGITFMDVWFVKRRFD
ncbi:membrane protein [soil metagenome]